MDALARVLFKEHSKSLRESCFAKICEVSPRARYYLLYDLGILERECTLKLPFKHSTIPVTAKDRAY